MYVFAHPDGADVDANTGVFVLVLLFHLGYCTRSSTSAQRGKNLDTVRCQKKYGMHGAKSSALGTRRVGMVLESDN